MELALDFLNSVMVVDHVCNVSGSSRTAKASLTRGGEGGGGREEEGGGRGDEGGGTRGGGGLTGRGGG